MNNTWNHMGDKWDIRFLAMAKVVAAWSKDPSTQCGAVIVRPDRSVASVGFNGFPRGCDDDPEIYEDRPRKYSRVVHAEVNAILAAREPLHGYTLYQVPGESCDRCAAVVIQAGITQVIHPAGHVHPRFIEAVASGREMFEEAGVELVAVEF